MSARLDVQLDTPLPARLPADAATSVFAIGTCFHPEDPIEQLEIVVDGTAYEVMAHSMPRIDNYLRVHPSGSIWSSGPDEPDFGEARAYRSGFWGTVPLRMGAEGSELRLRLRATLADGSRVETALATVACGSDPPGSAVTATTAAAIAICLASFDPDPELLAVQLDSIRAQTRGDWVCLISDDCSSPERFAELERMVAGDERFVLSRSPHRLGFYRNFERALRMVPESVGLVALSDQDDRWYPDKLATLADSLGRADLVYSDQRLVDADGTVLAPSYWSGPRSNNHTNLTSLLIANTVTGAASLLRRDLLDRALPFPATPGAQYHDHWLALSALTGRGIAYVDRPLYDYVQHGAATLGYEAANRDEAPQLPRLHLGRRLRNLIGGSRGSYFFAYCRLRVLAETLLLRGGDGLRPSSRRALERFVRADRSAASVAWLAARRLRALGGRTETLDAERIVLRGVLWPRGIALLGRLRDRPLPGITYDASLPPAPGDSAPAPGTEIEHLSTRALAAMVEPLEVSITDRAPRRVNLLVPTIELRHLFGGYIAKFNLARRLAERGHRVRIVAVDPTPALPDDWREQVEAYAGLAGVFEDVEVELARDAEAPLELNPGDRLIATTWWTAHVARAAQEQLDCERMLYMIQEFEPFTRPQGSWSAYAMATYEMPHLALFSTALLRDFFAANRYGVYARGRQAGDRDSAAFENAITAVDPPSVADLAARSRRGLLFYARPEPHGARNMFELGLLALRAAVEGGVFEGAWDLRGIGSVEGRDRVLGLGSGRRLELLSKRGQADYAALLGSHDVGLSLMYTPHPSLVPIEMASAGLLTVTNGFATKTPEAMAAISPNLLTVAADLESVVAGLREAVARCPEHEARRAGAEVAWSRSWEESFDDALMMRIEDLLERA